MEEEPCNISLGLGLGIGGGDFLVSSDRIRGRDQHKPPVQFHLLFSSPAKEEEEEQGRSRLGSKATDEEEDEANRDASADGGANNKGGARKKLRLSREQSNLLEDSFREHNTLNPTQKQELAERLSLRPRQVEVWYQNRRARTKLKQTEVDCEFLKKFCESLSDENRRLQKELQELRSIKPGPPFYIQVPKAAATLSMCPSCERIATAAATGTGLDATPAKLEFNNCTIKDSSMAC